MRLIPKLALGLAGAMSAMLALAAQNSPGGDAAGGTITVVRAATSLASAAPLSNPAPALGQASPTAAQEQYIRHDIAPNVVDPAAVQQPNKHTGQPNEHLVLVPTRPADRKGHLFLFIGGTNHYPSGTQEIMRAGVSHGYHAIAIAYSNYDAVGALCAASTDEDCTAKVREEIITGNDLTPLVTVDKPDAIVVRLRKLLRYLRDQFPGEGWERYLRNGEIDWELVSVAGHSQGAGHAAYLAKLKTLQRAVMISGVADVNAFGQPARWLYRPNLTPIDRQYGFSHLADPVVPFAIAEASWNAIGLDAFGPVVSVDSNTAPYNGSHKLSTVVLPASGTNAHVSTVGDETTPRATDGSPLYEPVWAFIAFP